MLTFAAIDIGSNSVRIKIARLVRKRLQTVHEDREVVRLGASVFAQGAFDPRAMAATIKALQRFAKAIRRYRCAQIRVVATSATRDARNGAALVEWIRSALGWSVEVITGLEEGRLIHLGILSNLRLGPGPVLLVDLGGGSCELTISEAGHIRQMVSLPLGAVRLTQQFLAHDPAHPDELERVRDFIAEELSPMARRIRSAGIRSLIATSGSAAALTGAALGRKVEERSGAVARATVERMAAQLAAESVAERSQHPGIGPKRAEIIVAGAIVYAELMARGAIKELRYSPLGLRDGLLAQLAAEHDGDTRPGRQIAADRGDAVHVLAERYGVDRAYATHVAGLTQEIFKRLQRVHGLPPQYGEWLEAAAMLCEIGFFVNRSGRHRHTHYLIAHSEIFGYTPAQRALIAAIARFQGTSHPSHESRELRPLPAGERVHVCRAIVLLRLARALNLGRRQAVRQLAARVLDGTVELRLSAGREGCELEIWAAEREREWFREQLGRELVVREKRR